MVNATLAPHELRDGYDLPVYGLDNGTFYYIHIPAMMCIVTSFVCAVIAIVLSFRSRGYQSFFTKWSKSERFVVYLALCDALFNVSHFTDHLHIAIAKNHVYPKALCEFYGFNLALFITAQNLMVNIVAINAFMLMYFNKNLEFGRYDLRLLAWTFGAPFLGASIAGLAGQLGTNGAFCYFDGVKGVITNICFTTVPLLLVLVMNVIFYVLTWKRIHEQCREIRLNLGTMSTAMRASHRAARAMSMFVAAFFVQWWAMALYGVLGLAVDVVPQPVHHMVTTFSNIGGILNLIVYCMIRKKQLSKGEVLSTEKKTKGTDASHSHSYVSRRNNNLHDISTCDSQVTEQPPATLTIIDNHLAVPTGYGHGR